MEINPLLGNLGAQGREFLALLQDQPGTEYAAFDPPLEADGTDCLLQRLQMDIFSLEDARLRPRQLVDGSITLVSAHSALREVQALHDWLLHQFNADSSLVPGDVLVTCPRIEDYAAAVQAVFAGSGEGEMAVPRLPGSIADRSLRDEEPLVAAFSELLDLPDSRFQVSQVLSLLRLPSVQARFDLTEEDLPVMERWLVDAAVHWGLDAKHKQQVLGIEELNEHFTWEQGLERLLLGFAWGDQAVIHDNRLLLPDVEGEEALLLGRLMEFVGGLKEYAAVLGRARPAPAWQVLLKEMQADLFHGGNADEQAGHIITSAIDELGEYTQAAGFATDIPLSVIRDWLRTTFSRPEPGRQFLVGQVSFCSMIPMRSLPFRIIAVLGLNDGDFPRQRPPRGFDLMAQEPPRQGDRSLRGDDRYLFLETLLSAREKLYLSYQGRDIRTNQSREPSLVLREFMDYLEKGYGWSLSHEARDLVQLPLQPFSIRNYMPRTGRDAPFHSFDKGWLDLLKSQKKDSALADLPLEGGTVKELHLDELLRFFDHPPRYFAHARLGLYLQADLSSAPDDHEPFVTSHLDRYLLQQQLVQAWLEGQDSEMLMRQARLSGHLPENPLSSDALEEWRDQAQAFAVVVAAQGGDQVVWEAVEIQVGGCTLQTKLPRVGDGLLFHRLANAKGKDDMRLWLHHLLGNSLPGMEGKLATRGIFRRKGKKEGLFQEVTFSPVKEAPDLLQMLVNVWQQGQVQPMLCAAELGKAWMAGLDQNPDRFPALWADDYNARGLGYDPYYHWFWPEMPAWEELPADVLKSIYEPLYDHRTEADL